MRNFVNQKTGEIHFYPLNYLEDLSFMDIPKDDVMFVERNGTDFNSILKDLYQLENSEGNVDDSFYQTVKLQLFNVVECQLCSSQTHNSDISLICQFAYLKSVEREPSNKLQTVSMSTQKPQEKVPDPIIVEEKVRQSLETPPVVEESTITKEKIDLGREREYYPVATVISKRTTYFLENTPSTDESDDEAMERSRKNTELETIYNSTDYNKSLNDSLLDESNFNVTIHEKEKKMMEVVKVVASIASVGMAVLLICCAYCMCCKGEDENAQQNQQS